MFGTFGNRKNKRMRVKIVFVVVERSGHFDGAKASKDLPIRLASHKVNEVSFTVKLSMKSIQVKTVFCGSVDYGQGKSTFA